MQDAITTLINSSDARGKYLDDASLNNLQNYFRSGDLRAKAAMNISANASTIVTKTIAKSLLYTDITAPGGNMYTCRRYAACVRDMEYFLRYATYAMLAGDPSILDERVLNGLKETYNSLGVPVGATVRSVQSMKEVVDEMLGADAGREMGACFDHICSGLS
ncbi:MAG: allophycocyanin subunit beta [Cyanobacteria bacterium P01_A01_bin.123]